MSGSGASVFAECGSRQEAEWLLDKAKREIGTQPIAGFVAEGLERHPLHGYA